MLLIEFLPQMNYFVKNAIFYKLFIYNDKNNEKCWSFHIENINFVYLV